VDWEHGGVDEVATPYRAAMLWYGTPRQTAVRSDRLVLGQPASVAAHRCRSPGQRLSTLTAAYQ